MPREIPRALTRLAAIPIVALCLPWQCSLFSPPPNDAGPPPRSPYAPKAGEAPAKRETLQPDKPAPNPVRMADDVVVHAIDRSRAGFLRCFRKASEADPSVVSYKVTVRVDIDPAGAVTAAISDAEDPALAACLARIARGLAFPAPERAAIAEFPLFFRPE